MSFAAPTRNELGFHEAGHAYAYASLNYPDEPEEIVLARRPDGSFAGWCKRLTLLDLETPFEGLSPGIQTHFRRFGAMEIVIAMAGPAAELRHAGNARTALATLLRDAETFLKPGVADVDGDFQRVRDVFAHLRPEDPPSTFRRLIRISADIVSMNWSSITPLARRLVKRGRLKREDIEKYLERHPPVRPGSGFDMDGLTVR